jgi:hypothetical protein
MQIAIQFKQSSDVVVKYHRMTEWQWMMNKGVVRVPSFYLTVWVQPLSNKIIYVSFSATTQRTPLNLSLKPQSEWQDSMPAFEPVTFRIRSDSDNSDAK